MKTIILAGGFGTRLGSITDLIPKPMVRIGNKPIIWHIMQIYAKQGFNDFILSLGYKSELIKSYFYNYHYLENDFSIDLKKSEVKNLSKNKLDWKVTLIDTGLKTLKGARIKRLEKHIGKTTMLTYGDGVAKIDLKKLLAFHKKHGKILTLTGVRPPSRFGEIKEKNGRLLSFEEKPQASSGYINGGFMIFDKKLLNYLSTDESCDLEYGAFNELAKTGQMMVYKSDEPWECVDTERDLKHLNTLYEDGKAFW